ncbi:MAG: hypothetical protein ACRCTZ_16090 [Sarcina sp.]
MKKIGINVEDIVFLQLPDGSNVQIELKEENLVELSFYTRTKDGTIREQPVLHMKNSNTFAVELRRK